MAEGLAPSLLRPRNSPSSGSGSRSPSPPTACCSPLWPPGGGLVLAETLAKVACTRRKRHPVGPQPVLADRLLRAKHFHASPRLRLSTPRILWYCSACTQEGIVAGGMKRLVRSWQVTQQSQIRVSASNPEHCTITRPGGGKTQEPTDGDGASFFPDSVPERGRHQYLL